MSTKLNYKKIVQDIDHLLQSDFCAEMEMKLITKGKGRFYTQGDALKMQGIISQVYKLSHVVHCEACRTPTVGTPENTSIPPRVNRTFTVTGAGGGGGVGNSSYIHSQRLLDRTPLFAIYNA